MNILAHRGYWKTEDEKNTLKAFEAAFQNGFGVETDIRDYCGKLVISHDIPSEKSLDCRTFFSLYRQIGNRQMLALNVKSDGIQELLRGLLTEYEIDNYFMFDMSVPEMMVYSEKGFHFFSRKSDVESEVVLYLHAKGIWMDSFTEKDVFHAKEINYYLEDGKKVALVSPELHGLDPTTVWHRLLTSPFLRNRNFYLCTDRPDNAELFLTMEKEKKSNDFK